ncbi:MAG: response regulator [Desulfobacterales bacterium]|nr:response regulator [Desulfobacterales bacterium]
MKKHRNVLIVDDEVDFLSSMRRALRKEPYRVLTAESGKAALRIIKAQNVDLVVSDYMMPEMDGLTLIKRIQSDYPHILTIMLTALAELDIAMQAINEAGVYKFILKPVEINSFRITLRRALESLDLLAEKEGLLQKIKNRDALLQELERKHPGITKVERDVDGYILSLD